MEKHIPKIAGLATAFAVLIGPHAAFAEREVDCSRYIVQGSRLSTTYIKFSVDSGTDRYYGTDTGHIVTFSSVTREGTALRGRFSGSFGSGGDMNGGWSGSQFNMFNPRHDQTYSGTCYDTGIRGDLLIRGAVVGTFTFAP